MSLLGLLHEVGVRHGVLGAGPRVELLDDREYDQADDQPDQEILQQVVQTVSFKALRAPSYYGILTGAGWPTLTTRLTPQYDYHLIIRAQSGRKPFPTRKTSRLRSREALGLRT